MRGRGDAVKEGLIVGTDRRHDSLGPRKGVVGRQNPSRVADNAAGVGIDRFLVAFGFAAGKQSAWKALGHLDYMILQGAVPPVQPPVWVSPKGGDIVGGQRVTVGDGAACDGVFGRSTSRCELCGCHVDNEKEETN